MAGMDAQTDPATLLVATLKFNSMSIEDGYNEADQDEDGKVSKTDLVGFCQYVQLGCSDDAVREFYKSLDPQAKGFVDRDVWIRALQAAEETSEELLVTRGISSTGTGNQDTTGVVVSEGGWDALLTSSGVANDVESAADQLAAALVYNELAPEEAFSILDDDEDNFISFDDLRTATLKMQLNITDTVLKALHLSMDERRNGLVEINAWCLFLSRRNTAEILRSRGVDESQLSLNSGGATWNEAPPAPAPAQYRALLQENLGTVSSAPLTSKSRVQLVSDTIAALLDFNNLDNREGFEAFDVDEDDLVSMSDLTKAAEKLSLEVDTESLSEWLQKYNISGSGMMCEDEWNTAINASNPTQVLASRGILLVQNEENMQPEAVNIQYIGIAVPTLNTTDTAQSLYTANDVESAADELVAGLRLNELSPRSGFYALDDDGDDFISLKDLQKTVNSLALQISPDALLALHKSMDERNNGLVEVDVWTRFLESRSTGSVRSRGARMEPAGDATPALQPAPEAVPESEAAPAPVPCLPQSHTPINTSYFVNVQSVSDTIAALLDFNNLAHLDGFEAFDVDADDKISIQDLTHAAKNMMLGCTAQHLQEWFKVVNKSGDGMMTFEEWDTALGFANSEDVLRSRGVVLADSEGNNTLPSSGHVETHGLSTVQQQASAEAGRGGDVVSAGASVASLTTKLSPRSAVQEVTDTLAALLKFNRLTVEDGFNEFDRDQDGLVSFSDLIATGEQLELDVAAADLQQWYAFFSLGTAAGISSEAWSKVLSGANAERILQSRGVDANVLSAASPPASTATASSLNTQTLTQMSPLEVSDTIAALLKYNDLSLKEGFRDFDEDGDDKISQQDFDFAVAQLQLDVSETDLNAWYRHFNTAADGFMTFDEWMAALTAADADSVLRSRGVDTVDVTTNGDEGASTESAVAKDTSAVLRVAEAISASLKHNELSDAKGYDAVDMDDDGKLSLQDLLDASSELQLDLEASDFEQFLAHIEEKGGGTSREQQMFGWMQILGSVDGTSVLQARGLLLTAPAQAKAAPAAEVPAPAAEELTPAAAAAQAQVEATNEESTPSSLHAETPTPAVTPSPAQSAPAQQPTVVPEAAPTPAAPQIAAPAAAPVTRAKAMEAPSPRAKAMEAPSPPAVAPAPAVVSWETAVPAILTLDIDFNLIVDQEKFKQDFIKDIATAANIDVRYFKIASLRSGSVIVEFLIAQEAGESDKIYEGLVQQLESPDSLLRKGKWTSKTKSLTSKTESPAHAALPATKSPEAAAPDDTPAAATEKVQLQEEIKRLQSPCSQSLQQVAPPAAAATTAADAAANETAPATSEADAAEIERLRDEVDELEFANKQLKQHADKHVQHLEEELNELKEAHEELKNTFEKEAHSHQKFQKDAQIRVEELEKEIVKLQSDCQAANKQVEQLSLLKSQPGSQDVNASGTVVATTNVSETEVSQLQAEFEDAKRQIQELQTLLDAKNCEQGVQATQGEAPATAAADWAAAAASGDALVKEIEGLKAQMESETQVKKASLEHVKSLETEIETLRKLAAAPPASGTAGAGADAVTVARRDTPDSNAANEEIKDLKLQVSSLTFQLQELQGVSMTPRLTEIATQATQSKKTLDPPPNPALGIGNDLARHPSLENKPASKRNVLEPPPSALDLGGMGGMGSESSGRRSSSSSRRQSPERLSVEKRTVVTASPLPSPPLSPSNSMGSITFELSAAKAARDEARAELAKAHNELNHLRAVTSGLEANLAAHKMAYDLECQTIQVSMQATVAALGEKTQDLQQALKVAAVSDQQTRALLWQAQEELSGITCTVARVVSAEGKAAAEPAAAASEVAQLQEQIKTLQSELQSLKQAVPPAAAAPVQAAPTADAVPVTSLEAAEMVKMHEKINALQCEVLSRKQAEEESERKLQAMQMESDSAVKMVQTLQAEVDVFEGQISNAERLVQEAASGNSSIQSLNMKLAEALSSTSAEQSKVARLKAELQTIQDILEKTKQDNTNLKKEKLDLLHKATEAENMQRTISVTAEQEALTLKSSGQIAVAERDLLRQQVNQLEVQLVEMRGTENTLRDQLASAVAEVAGLKDAKATIELNAQKSELIINQLKEAEAKLHTRLDELTLEKAKSDTKVVRIKAELEQYNGSHYGEVQSLKAQLEIMRKEKEVLEMENAMKDIAQEGVSNAATTTPKSTGGAHVITSSPHVSPQRRRNDAYFGEMEDDLRLSQGALNSVQQMLETPLSHVDREINRIREERANSPTRTTQTAQPVNVHRPPPQQQHVQFANMTYSPASSPSRRDRQSRDLREKLDLLAAALSYNGLTVISGFSAFDQDRDGRVSVEDLRKSMNDLELAMQRGELQVLFNFMDANQDGYISEMEWGMALRDADPFSVLASQGVRTLEIQVPPNDADAPLQAVDAFEAIKNELAKSLEAQKRMKASLDQAARGRAELEEDLRRIRKTRSDLESELKSVRADMSLIAQGGGGGSVTYTQAAPAVTTPYVVDRSAEVFELQQSVSALNDEIASLRQQLSTAESSASPATVTTTTVVDRSGEDALRREIADLTTRLSQAHVQSSAAASTVTTTNSSSSLEELTNLRSELQGMRTEASNFQAQLLSLRETEQRMTTTLREKDAKITTLESQLSAASTPAPVSCAGESTVELENLKSRLRDITVAKEASEECEKSLTAELSSIKASLVERESAIEQLKTRVAEIEGRELKKTKELGDLKLKYAETQELFQKACTERDAASQQLASAKSAQAFAKEQQQSKASELVRLETELAHLRAQTAFNEEASNRLVELQALVTVREADVTKLKEESKTQTMEIARLKGENSAQKEVHSSQIAEMQALAGDARLCAIEREHKVEAQNKLHEAQLKIQNLEEQIDQLHVLRSTEVAKANESATLTVQERFSEKETEVQRLQLELEQARGDLQAARRDRDAMVVRQTQSLQDEVLRLSTLLSDREQHAAGLKQQAVGLEQQVDELQQRLQSTTADASTKVDTAVVIDYKRSLELKEGEIEELRRKHAQEFAASNQELEKMHDERVGLNRQVATMKDELIICREEIDGLKKQLRDASDDTGNRDTELHTLREEKQNVERDFHLARTQGQSAESSLARANAELERLREIAGEVTVMKERVRAAESETALAQARLEKVDGLQRELQRKDRDLAEERERYDRLRAELQETRGAAPAARTEWESKYALLEKHLADVENMRHKAEFDLEISVKEGTAIEAKMSEITDELATSRVRISSLESDLKFAQSGKGIDTEQLQERVRELTASKDKYDRKYRDSHKETKQAQEHCAKLERRIKEMQEALNSAIDPNVHEAIRRAEDTAAHERETRKAVQAQLDAMNEEHKRLKAARIDAPLPSATGPSDSNHLHLRVRSLLRENAECHAQIRLLGAEVVGLSEALEIVTKRAHDGEARQAHIQNQVEYVTKGVASNRALRPSGRTSSSKRPASTGRAAVARSPNPSSYSEHERYYYPNELYPSRGHGAVTPTPGRDRPSSADMRRRPASAGRRPASAREGMDDRAVRAEYQGGNRDSSDFQMWLEDDRVSGSTIVGRAEAARAEAWGAGVGNQMPKLQGRDRDTALAVANTRDEVYYGVAGGRHNVRSP